MKTKALLLTLMILTAFSCSNDDNNPVEEQEEEQLTEYKIKKFTRNNQVDNYTQELHFKESGLLDKKEEFYNSSPQLTYYFHYDNNNRIIKKQRYINGDHLSETLEFIYDNERLVEVRQQGQTLYILAYEEMADGSLKIGVSMDIDSFSLIFNSEGFLIKTTSSFHFGTNITNYYYSAEKPVTIESVTFNPDGTTDTEVATMIYDDKINPLYEDHGNWFGYYHNYNYILQISTGSYFYSSNNVVEYNRVSANINVVKDFEYNEHDYPVNGTIIRNGETYETITFEYYE